MSGPTMEPRSMRVRGLYVIDTSLGRKLIRAVKVSDSTAHVSKLRATSLRWTRPEGYQIEVLRDMGLREPGPDDQDLLAAAKRADDKDRERAAVARRLAR